MHFGGCVFKNSKSKLAEQRREGRLVWWLFIPPEQGVVV